MRGTIPTLVLLALGACGEPARPPRAAPPAAREPAAAPPETAAPEPPAPPAAKRKLADLAEQQVIPALTEALSQHDAKKLASYYADGATLTWGNLEPARGRDAIAATMQRVFDAIATMKVQAWRGWVREGVVVVYEWTLTGTHSGDFEGHAPTERPIAVEGASLLLLDDAGLVKDERAYVDTAAILAQSAGSGGFAARPKNVEWHVAPVDASDANVELAKALLASPDAMQSARIASQLQGASVVAGRAWAIDDSVIVEASEIGVPRRAPPGSPSVTVRALEIVQLRDGKIARRDSYGDTSDIARASPKSAPKPAPSKGAPKSAATKANAKK